MRPHWLLACLASVAASACGDSEPPISLAYDAALPKRLVADDIEWHAACRRPSSERIGFPLRLRARAAHQTSQRAVAPEFVADLAKVIEGLPRPLARLFQRHVCTVTLVHGAPMSGTVQPLAGDMTRSIVFLNVDYLSDLSPNAWLSFKESTPFEAAAELEIRGVLAEPSDDERRVLIEFVLVHELGHVVDVAYPDHLLIEEFKSSSWPRRDRLARMPLIHYPWRLSKRPLPDEHVEPYYDLIARGPFASPATVSSAREDFADSLATFVHTIVRGRPFELEVYRSDRVVRRLKACWQEPRCRKKRRILERLLERWGSD